MSDIMLSIARLNDYADRIGRINDRISRLESRVRSLYNRVGYLDLWNLIRVSALTSNSGQLRRCQSYLEQTANDFQKTENVLESYDHEGSILAYAVFSQGINMLRNFSAALAADDKDQPISIPSDSLGDDLLSYYIDEYKEILNGDGSTIEKKDATIEYLSKLSKRAKYAKELYMYSKGLEKLKLPVLDDSLKFIKYIDMGNKTLTGTYEFFSGVVNGDNVQATEGSEKLIGVAASLFKGSNTIKSFGSAKAFGIGLGIDYGKNVVINFMKGLQEDEEISEVLWDTFATSAFDTGVNLYEDYIYNELTLSVAYPITKKFTSWFGFDLDAAYMEAMGETGIQGAVSGFKELTGIIREESSWENWCSGMAIIGKGIKNGWNNLKDGWNNFWGNLF